MIIADHSYFITVMWRCANWTEWLKLVVMHCLSLVFCRIVEEKGRAEVL